MWNRIQNGTILHNHVRNGIIFFFLWLLESSCIESTFSILISLNDFLSVLLYLVYAMKPETILMTFLAFKASVVFCLYAYWNTCTLPLKASGNICLACLLILCEISWSTVSNFTHNVLCSYFCGWLMCTCVCRSTEAESNVHVHTLILQLWPLVDAN